MMFSLTGNAASKRAEVAELAEKLKPFGVTVTLKTVDKYTFLDFDFDDKKIKTLLTRNAGRKEKFLNRTAVPVAEIRSRMDNGEQADEIAASLGVSRATLFRKLKHAKDNNLDELF